MTLTFRLQILFLRYDIDQLPEKVVDHILFYTVGEC
jgi:hypothetical protein